MPLLHEMRMLLKVLILIVFEHEHAAFAQQVPFKNEVDQFVVMFAVVRRVGEDEVVLHRMLVQKTENIGADDKQLLHIEFVGCLSNKLHATKVLVDGHDLGATS